LVGPDHQVEVARLGPLEGDPHPVFGLVECGDRVAEQAGPVGVRAEQADQVLAQHLDVGAVETAAAPRHLGRAHPLSAVAVDHGHAAHPGPQRAQLRQQAHPVDHVECHAADVDCLATRAEGGGTFHDRRFEAVVVQPEGERRAGDPGA
jgi:hypothetical protein